MSADKFLIEGSGSVLLSVRLMINMHKSIIRSIFGDLDSKEEEVSFCSMPSMSFTRRWERLEGEGSETGGYGVGVSHWLNSMSF